MKILKIILLIALSVFLVAGCKSKSKEADQSQAIVPPVDTTPKVDSAALQAADTMPAVEETPGMPPVPKGSGYAVQVASCNDEQYARYLVELWKGRGYEPFVSTITQNNANVYRVRLGLFESQAKAKSVAAELADKYSLKTWIEQVTN